MKPPYCVFESNCTDTYARSEVFKLSKRIAKLILKDHLQKLSKEKKINYGSIFVLKNSYSLPIDFVYDGKMIICSFFTHSLFSSTISIMPSEIDDFCILICKNIEKIFDCITQVSVENVTFQLLPGKDATSQSVIVFSYTSKD